MAGKTTPVLLVTANVGSIFEDPSHMLKIWTEEFLSTVAKLDPKFIALHCQEVGGKNYERSMKHVEDFVRLFMSSEELRLFDKVRVFLDEDYSSAENFTALGNFYFIHESLAEVLIWDFAAMNFVSAKGKEVHSGNIEAVTTKEKSKFPQDFFPECKWSRKGFLRTRWSLNGTVFDLINIHLFHDASNFIAMESFPSVYSKNRKRALEHTLERFHNDSYGIAPFFVFGDFNFRTDTQGVINKLSDGLNVVRVQSNKNIDHTKLHYKDEESQVVLSLGKKEFSHADHQKVFLYDNGLWLKEFDREMDAFGGRLFEFPISFPPSYPFEEDEKGGNDYMKTRCPAWCDRVLLSNTAKNLVNNISDPNFVEYGLMGPNTRMGDHKPVYLKMDLINNAGTVSCCTPCESSSSEKRVLCFGNVAVCETASWSCSSLSLKNSGSAPSALTLKLDTSAAALAADCFLAPPHASLLHEPYTPESMETPSSSPVPLRIERDFEEVHWKLGLEEDGECSETNETDDIKINRGSNKELCINDTTNVNQSEDSEYNIKQSLSLLNKSSQCGLKSCIPHVLICFSDPQDRSVSNSKLEMKTSDVNSRHLEPNFASNQRVSHEGLNHLKYSEDKTSQDSNCANVCQQSLMDIEERTKDLSVQSIEIVEDESNTICSESQDNLLSPQNTCSSDSGILPSASYSSSSQSLTQSISKEVTSDLNEGENDVLYSKNSNLFQLERLVSDLSTEYDGRKTSLECVLGSTYLQSEDNFHCRSENEIMRIDEIPLDNLRLNIPSEENIASSDINSCDVEDNKSKNECLVPEGVSEKAHKCSRKVVPSVSSKLGICANVRRDSDVETFSNIPLNSQDSISVVQSEISSQDKTKGRKYKKKKKDLKTKRSNCCSVS